MANFFKEREYIKKICSERSEKAIIRVKRNGNLLTTTELMAYEIIELAMTYNSQEQHSFECILFSQVHLYQIFEVDGGVIEKFIKENNITGINKSLAPGEIRRFWKDEMGRKSVDILACRRDSSEIVYGVEIDGSSHSEKDQVKWDEIKNFIFKSAGIPLIRFTNEEIKDIYVNNMEQEVVEKIVQDRYDAVVGDFKKFHGEM